LDDRCQFAALAAGAFRVHDVAEHVAALKVFSRHPPFTGRPAKAVTLFAHQ
jgi:hypothetical protein